MSNLSEKASFVRSIADFVIESTCVRKGTRVWSPTPALPAGGEGVNFHPLAGGLEGGQLAGGLKQVKFRTESGEAIPTEVQDQVKSSITTKPPLFHLLPVESLRPGDWALAHDRQPHRIHAVITRLYHGKMIGIFLERSELPLWVTEDHYVLCDLTKEGYPFIENRARAVPPVNYARARQMRKDQTPAERRLWSALRGGRGRLKFRRQHNIGPYIVDFYCREARFVIEVDGGQHQEPENQIYDWARDSYLHSKGLKVLRFWNDEVIEDLDGVIRKIAQYLVQPFCDQPDKEWLQADMLQEGDIVFCGPELSPVRIVRLEEQETDEIVYDLQIEGVQSFVTEACAVHNCSGYPYLSTQCKQEAI